MSDVTLIVTNSKELVDAMATLASGDGGTILLKNEGETYAGLFQDAGDNEPPITIKSFDENDRAIIEKLEFRGRENITVENVVFDSKDAPEDRSIYTKDLMVSNSKAITIKDSTFQSTADGMNDGVGDEKLVTDMGLIRSTEGFTFENNSVSGYSHGLAVLETIGIAIKGNEFFEMQGDGLRLGGVQDVVIENNYMHDFFGSLQSLNHDDMIQFWGANTTLRTENVVIRGNILDASNGSGSQAIFGRNEEFETEDDLYQNILIEDNIIHNSAYHGITMSDTNGLIIRNNTVLWNQDAQIYSTLDAAGSYTPGIKSSNSQNVTVSGNITPSISVPDGVDTNNNAIISYDNKLADGYIEKHFINALVGGSGDLRDLMLLPDSEWTGLFGSKNSQPSATADSLTSVMTIQEVKGDFNSFTFSAIFSQDETGYLDESEATFTWTFSDGTVLFGRTVEKTFAESGVMDSTLTVATNPVSETLKGAGLVSQTDSITRNVTVQDKVLLSLDFDDGDQDGGYQDGSTYGSEVSYADLAGGAVTADGVSGSGFRLDGTTKFSISRENAQIHNLEVFSLGMAVMRDADDDGGYILQFHKTLTGRISANGAVSFTLTTPDGDFTITSSENTISDDGWHKVFVTYDSVNEVFSLYVDGDLSAHMTATGPTPSKVYWGLDLGGSWGNSIEGVIDDFSLTADVKTASEIADDYQEMEANLNRITSSGEDVVLVGDKDDNTYVVTGQDGAEDFKVKVKGFGGADNIVVEDGKAVIRGNAGNDSITLGDANDIAFGGRHADVLAGGAGDDQLVGNQGRDTLFGQEGDDILIGAKGNDVMAGGAGADVFQFYGQRNENKDTIMDFDVESDIIRITQGQDFSDVSIEGFDFGTIISLSSGTEITLQNVDVSTVDIDNFEFV